MTSARNATCVHAGDAALVTARAAPFDAGVYGAAHPRPFLCDVIVAEHGSANVAGHVSNIEYVRWLDRGAELHADSLGCSRRWLASQDRMWFVARHEIDYLAETWPGDRLVLATWVRAIRKVKSWRDTLIVRPRDSTVIARASTLWVLVALSTRKPVRIPAGLTKAFDPFPCEPAPAFTDAPA